MELLEASKCGQLEDVNYLLMTGVNVNVATVVSDVLYVVLCSQCCLKLVVVTRGIVTMMYD